MPINLAGVLADINRRISITWTLSSHPLWCFQLLSDAALETTAKTTPAGMLPTANP